MIMRVIFNVSHFAMYWVLFIFLYNPPVVRNDLLIHILAIMGAFTILRSYKNKKIFVNLLKETKIWFFSLALFFICIYLLVFDCIGRTADVAYGRIYIYMILAIELVMIAFYICLYYWKTQKNWSILLKDLLIVGNIQGIIALVAFLNPSIKSSLTTLMFANGVDTINSYLLSVRFYGFATYLTSTTAIIQIVLGVIAIWMCFEKSYKYVIYVPLLFFSAIINARSTLVIGGIGIGLIILWKVNLKNKRIIKEIFITIIIIIFCKNIVIPKLHMLDSWEWIQSGIDEIFSFFKGNESGYFEYLNNKFFFPEKMSEFLFGTGHSVFRANVFSDVGYVNDVWMIGVILTAILYLSYLAVIVSKYGKTIRTYRFIKIFLALTFIIYNIKGIVIGNNEIVRLSILIAVSTFFVTKSRKEVEEKWKM